MFHASYLFLIILIRDLVKDLQNFRGDWVRGYHTVAVTFGIRTTKAIISVLIVLSAVTVFHLLSEKNQLGGMFSTFYCPYLPFGNSDSLVVCPNTKNVSLAPQRFKTSSSSRSGEYRFSKVSNLK